MTDEQVDAIVRELAVRYHKWPPVTDDEHRWAAEGKRRLFELDTFRSALA